MTIPFVDLRAQYKSIQQDIDSAICGVITDAAFIGGKYVKEFEQQFAALFGAKHVVSCGNGTDSLYIIMKMLGIGPGDEVITAANSWISSSETITQTGARPVFVDAHGDYFSMNEEQLESKITDRTKAIIVVHLQGQVCDMSKIMEIANRHDVPVIEDCAQAHFSEYKGKRVGLFGIASSFSFYPGKNLGAYGDAGCIVTNDDALAEKCRMFANHGALIKHHHQMEGINSRLDGLQAAILTAKLPYIHNWTEARIKAADRYDALLSGIEGIVIPRRRPETRHTYHLYVICAERRDQLAQYLKAQGIETAIHYPTPLPFLPAYQYLQHQPEHFPVAAAHQARILSLPIYAEIREEQQEYVAKTIRVFYNGA